MANLKLGIDTRGVLSGQRQFNNSITSVKNNVMGLGQASNLTKIAMTRLALVMGTAVVASAGYAIKSYKDFEQEMRRVNSVVGGNIETFERLSEIARELGATTNFTARQASGALYNLASAGFTVEEQAKALRDTLLFAGASAIQLEKATDIVSTTLRQFNIEASNTSKVTNVMASAIASSRASADRLQESLRYVGPVAGSLNIELEETVAVLSKLYDAGLEGSQAGTTLRNAMIKLINPIGRGVTALKEMGLTTEDLDIKTIGLIEVFETLRQAKITEAQASQLFGQEGINIIRIINQGSEALNDYKDSITDTNKAQEMYNEQTDTLIGDVDKLTSATSELALKLGKDLNPVARATVQELKTFVDYTNATYEGLKETGGAINYLSIMFSTLAINVLNATKYIMTEFEPSITFLRNGFELSMLAITSLISVVGKVTEFRMKNIYGNIKNTGINIVNFLADQIQGVLSLYQAGFDRLPEWLRPEWYKNLLAVSNDFTENLRKGLGEKVEVKGIKEQFEEVKNIVKEVGELTRNTFDELFLNVDSGSLQTTIDYIEKLIEELEEGEIALFEKTFENFSNGIKEAEKNTEDLGNKTEEVTKKMKRWYDDLAKDINTIFSDSADNFSQAFADSIMGTKNAFDDFFKDILNKLLQLQIQKSITAPLFSALGFSGGSSIDLDSVEGFAGGGITPINKPFIVGERGPEVMRLGQHATVTPNHKIGGETNITVINNTPAVAKVQESENDSGGKDISIIIDEVVAGKIAQGGKTQKAITSVFGINARGY